MNITIINNQRSEKHYTRISLEQFVQQVADDTSSHNFSEDYKKDVCFAGEWVKRSGVSELRTKNPLVLLSLENLRDLQTAIE